jgi:SlyX protein
MDGDPDRLTVLEMRAAEQDRVIEELSGEIAEQWKAIDRLRRQVEGLAERFGSLEEALPPAQSTRPPHW